MGDKSEFQTPSLSIPTLVTVHASLNLFSDFFFARTIIFLSFIILVCSWKYVGWFSTDDSPSHCSHVPVGVLCKCWGGRVPNYMFQNASFVWPYHHQSRLSLSSLWSHFERQSSCSELLLPTNALAFANSTPCISRKRDIILSTSSWWSWCGLVLLPLPALWIIYRFFCQAHLNWRTC